MAGLGPWPAARRVAVAVSGGADSLCLAWLARHWGDPVALIIDHGLRPESGMEARQAAARLAAFGVPSRIFALHGLSPGPGLAARARDGRYACLTSATREARCADLLLGHHAGDQAETLLIRRASGSSAFGLAGMAAVTETHDLRLVRPLLGVPQGRLRATLRAHAIGWADDPSNRNAATGRARARLGLDDPDGSGPATIALVEEAGRNGRTRADTEKRIAATLAARARIFPEGYALLSPGPVDPGSLAALIRMLGGAPYAPGSQAVAALASGRHFGTLGGVRLMQAGRLGPGILLVREAAAMRPAVAARPGAVWDGRFRLEAPVAPPPGATIGALGEEAQRFRRPGGLPAAVLATLPAVRGAHGLVAVPHLGYFKEWTNPQLRLRLCSPSPAASAGFGGEVHGMCVGGCATGQGTPCP